MCSSSLLILLALTPAIGSAEPEKPAPLTGWLGVFPELQGYSRTFTAPVVAKGEKPADYRQTVRYEWAGGAIRILNVTLARDPSFKEKHTAEALRKGPMVYTETKLGKHPAWLWKRDGEGAKPDELTARLI